jgi:hypothetical protein
VKYFSSIIFFVLSYASHAQSNSLKIEQALQKKAEYHKATNGQQDGYRIKIHFGIDKEAAETLRVKFSKSFPDCLTYREYQQPNFVILVGNFKTKLEAFKFLNEIKTEFPQSYIVKGRIES